MKWVWAVLILLLAGIAAAVFRSRRNAERKYRLLLDGIYAEIEKLLKAGRYYSVSEIRRIKDKYSDRIGQLRGMKNPLPEKDTASSEKLAILFDLEGAIQKANLEYIESEKRNHADFFRKFDDSQAEAIIRDEEQMLVLAGAGSGKTKTIEGLVRYLTECRHVNPSQILLISFTNATVDDLNSRDLNGAKARTFHNIGNDITRKGFPKDRAVSIYSDDKAKIVREFLNVPYEDPEFLHELTDYYLYDMVPPEAEGGDDKYVLYESREKDQKGFLSYRSLLMTKSVYSVTGQRFKSKEEARIANYLFLHGINFEYEKKYQVQINDGIHNAYKPDFYLTDYDIYLEHFGVNKKMEVPFTWGRPDAADQEKKYVEGMKWKLDTHRKYGTKLIVTYSYYFTEGTILEHLEKQLKENGVEIKDPDPKDLQRIFEKIGRTQSQQIDSFVRLVATFITQYKSTGKSSDPAGFSALYRLNESNPPYRQERTARFLNIAEKAYRFYQDRLEAINDIDFEDMINYACRMLESETERKKLVNDYGSFRYVIIDEYQDISSQRMKLANLICGMSGAKLFCVGDDWQSIYRFTGSDLSNILDFGKDFPDYMQLALANTYRNSQQLTNAASAFIQMNPGQMKKTIHSSKTNVSPIHVVMTYGEQFPYLLEVLGEIYTINPSSSVYVLGRYNSDLNNLAPQFKDRKHGLKAAVRDDEKRNIAGVEIGKYEGMGITFSTIHRSKGLEADYVIVLGLSSDRHGFPSRIENDPVLDLVLPVKDRYPFEEERRLYYVALTRTKNRVYLLTDASRPSEFVTETLKLPHVIQRIDITEKIRRPPSCPKCGRSLVERHVPGKSPFWACPGFPECSYTLPMEPVIPMPPAAAEK